MNKLEELIFSLQKNDLRRSVASAAIAVWHLRSSLVKQTFSDLPPVSVRHFE